MGVLSFLVDVVIFGVLGVCAPFGATFTALMLLVWVLGVFRAWWISVYCSVWAGPCWFLAVSLGGQG